MALEIYPMDVILLLSFDVKLCSIGIWSILVHISWHLFLVLATNMFFWEVPASYVDLDVLHPLNHDFPSEFLPISSCYLVHRPFLLYRPLYLLPRLGHPLSLVLEQLLSLLLYFSWFLWVCCFLLLLFSSWSLWFLLLFFTAIIFLLITGHLCCLLWYPLFLFLTGYLPSYLFFQEYGVIWSHSLVTSNIILLVVYLICGAPESISNSHSPSRFRMFLLCSASTASILLRLLLLLAVPYYRFHNFIPLVASFLIKTLLVSISLLVFGKVLLLLYVLMRPFPLWIFLLFWVMPRPVDLWFSPWVLQTLSGVLSPISIPSCLSAHLVVLLYDWNYG